MIFILFEPIMENIMYGKNDNKGENSNKKTKKLK